MKPGELLALMGASGAGKTTLLNSLVFRNTNGLNITGDRRINGHLVDGPTLSALSAYIQQQDLFIGSLTPREHLTFQALLRMQKEIPYKQRLVRVEETLVEVSLLPQEKLQKSNHLLTISKKLQILKGVF